jgi:hypothetical protein
VRLPEKHISIGIEYMLGCPGYISLFLNICDLLQIQKEKAPGKLRTAALVSKVEIGRRRIIAQGLRRLLMALVDAGSEVIAVDVINDIDDTQTVITLDVVRDADDTRAARPRARKV